MAHLRLIASFALALAAPLALPAAAQTPPAPPRPPRLFQVPGDFPSIQRAIDESRHGDTVLVAPGRYYENIRFNGKAILLTSRFMTSRDPKDIEATILDGSRPKHPDTASVVMFVKQEDTTSVLQGFTITGGKGTVWLDAKDHMRFREGGGILCELSAPIIQFNHIQDNEAVDLTGVQSAGGGGIRAGYAEPVLRNNVVRRNRGRYGAGVVLFLCAATVHNNLIAGNVGGEDFGGSGLWVVAPLSRRLGNRVEYNTIVNNVATREGVKEPKVMNGLAGGVWTTGVRIEFRNNIVFGNTQGNGDQFDFTPNAPLALGLNLVQGGINGAPASAGGTVLKVDPRFVDTARFELKPDSPAGRGADQLGAYGGPGAARLLP